MKTLITALAICCVFLITSCDDGCVLISEEDVSGLCLANVLALNCDNFLCDIGSQQDQTVIFRQCDALDCMTLDCEEGVFNLEGFVNGTVTTDEGEEPFTCEPFVP